MRAAWALAVVVASNAFGSATIAAPTISAAPYGATRDGQAVRIFTLRNDTGFEVRLLDYGGAIVAIMAPDRLGRLANAVVAMPDLGMLEDNSSFNTLIGRYANRIKGGFTLGGVHYPLPANDAGVTLHGGPQGYNRRVWQAVSFSRAGRAGVKLSLVSPDGDQGFPGRVAIAVTYSIGEDAALRLDFEATSNRATPVSLTNHTYFNLTGTGGSTESHELQVFAESYTPTDAAQVPTGAVAPVADTPFDFRAPKPVGRDLRAADPQLLLARGYDHNFVLTKSSGDPHPLAARLRDPASGRVVELRTSEPGLQVYSGNFLNGRVIAADGKVLRQGDAIALEAQRFPDAPNKPGFPNAILTPGQTYRSTTIIRLTTDADQNPR